MSPTEAHSPSLLGVASESRVTITRNLRYPSRSNACIMLAPSTKAIIISKSQNLRPTHFHEYTTGGQQLNIDDVNLDAQSLSDDEDKIRTGISASFLHKIKSFCRRILLSTRALARSLSTSP